MSESEHFDLPHVDAITTGSIGEPGSRVFYVQIWAGGRIVSLKLEKQQVAALSAAIAELLADLPPPAQPLTPPDLLDPGAPDWTVGTMAMTSFDEVTGRAVLVLNELVPEDEEGASARLGLTADQLAALAIIGAIAVEGGRPPCPLCGRPLDPTGHVCPKTNGAATH